MPTQLDLMGGRHWTPAPAAKRTQCYLFGPEHEIAPGVERAEAAFQTVAAAVAVADDGGGNAGLYAVDQYSKACGWCDTGRRFAAEVDAAKYVRDHARAGKPVTMRVRNVSLQGVER